MSTEASHTSTPRDIRCTKCRQRGIITSSTRGMCTGCFVEWRESCVNAHDELVSALEAIIAKADKMTPDNVYQAEAIMLFRDVIEPARAALAKAKGVQP